MLGFQKLDVWQEAFMAALLNGSSREEAVKSADRAERNSKEGN